MAGINPFQPPMNYSIDVQSPFEAALGGFKLGAAGAEVQAQTQAREKAQTYQTNIDAFFKKPVAERTHSDIEPLLVGANKQQFDALQAVAKNMTDEQLSSSKRFYGQLLVSLEQNPETAKLFLQNRIDAETNPQQKLAWQDMLKTIDISPKIVADNVELLGTATFGKDWYEGITKVREERRTAALAPEAQRKAVADADAAEADAKTKLATATNAGEKAAAEAELARAQANKAKVDAKFAEQVALADLKNKAATLGLTDAQRNKVLVETSQLSIAIKKAVLELEALKAGTPDPAKAFQQEENLRKEYQARTKVYSELGTTYSNIESSSKAKSGPGDIALITGFMKMLDPGSVVRETEFATARDTAGLYTRLENSLKKAESGQFLQPKQREEFVNLAKQYLDSAQKKSGEDRKALGVVVKNYKLNPDNVFGPETTATNDPNIVIVGGRNYTRPANFNDAQWAEYKKSVGAQ